jgi:hypothetical protein
MAPFISLSLSLFAIKKLPNYFTGKIASDERVIFFPTAASALNETHWHVPIHGWIFEPEQESVKRKAFLKLLRKVFSVSKREEKEILYRRVMPFAVDNKSRKYVKIKFQGLGDGAVFEDCDGKIENIRNDKGDLGDSLVCRLPRSSKDGHFFANLTLDGTSVKNMIKDEDDPVQKLHFQAVTVNKHDNRTFPGVVHFIPPTGISIVSDIDDTVKVTNVGNKTEFYKNTFLRPFRPVPGIVQHFTDCESHYENCCFHYVSASPYQLFEELHDFLKTEGFPPPSSMHLKKIRIKDKTLLQLLADPQDYKIRQIEPLLNQFPNRTFIFVGDSGEKDPEIYKTLVRKYPSQVKEVWIRNVNNSTQARMNGLEENQWQYFNDGSDLKERIMQ